MADKKVIQLSVVPRRAVPTNAPMSSCATVPTTISESAVALRNRIEISVALRARARARALRGARPPSWPTSRRIRLQMSRRHAPGLFRVPAAHACAVGWRHAGSANDSPTAGPLL